MAWMEEILFRTLEKHIIGEKLSGGLESFISSALSVMNRRKSRVGFTLEHHLETLFQECGIKYSRSAFTENRSKSDFIFPGKSHNPDFDELNLTMLKIYVQGKVATSIGRSYKKETPSEPGNCNQQKSN